MTTLLVQQILKNGSSKTWKLRPAQLTQTFGSSRQADLISISPLSAGIEAVFEFKNNAWSYHHMNSLSLQSADAPSVRVEKEHSITLADGVLVLTPVMREQNLLSKLEALKSPSGHGKTFQLFIAKQGDRVTDIKILPLGKKYKSILSLPTQDWHYQALGNIQVQQRSVEIDDMSSFAHLSADGLVDDESRKGVYVVLAMTLVVLMAGLFGPKSQKEMALTEIPKVVQKIIVKTDIKKHAPKKEPVKAEEKKMVANITPPASAPKTAESQSKGGKVANMLKSLSGGRISQLIGKVSSQAAKSANVIVSNGVKAGQGGSGRALAALGSVEKSGRDWGTESSGKDVVISTAGRGGGKNASGMGGLAAGSTGSAGVGLIEEESEITGGLDREVIAQYIKSQLGQILYCYERQLSASPDLFGKVAVKFTIGGNGGVVQQLIGDTTLKNATVEGCILNRVAAWKFPAPQGGTKVLVTYPFLFKSTN